jgi:hypothetical protein
MTRYIQRVNPDGTSRLDEVGVTSKRDRSASVHGDIHSFVSPVDGSVITDRKQLREHNKRNNVVNTQEFSQDFLDKKKKERERHYTGEKTREETYARRCEMNEIINNLTNQG